MNDPRIRGRPLVLMVDNIDTDQIIAAEHLKTLNRRGLGRHAFASLRATNASLGASGDAPASILLSGRNFGCGSSREHAVWAILDLGVRAVIAESFSDIFAGNAFKNGLVTIALAGPDIRTIAAARTGEILIDLERQRVEAASSAFDFELDPFRRECLLLGLDEIGLALTYQKDIAAYENRRRLVR